MSVCDVFATLYATVKNYVKQNEKYVGTVRKVFNLLLCIAVLTFVVTDLGYRAYISSIFDPKGTNIAIPVRVGGFIGGFVTGFIVLNMFQKSVGQQRMR